MREFHAETTPLKRDEIATDTQHLLPQHVPRRASGRMIAMITQARAPRRGHRVRNGDDRAGRDRNGAFAARLNESHVTGDIG